MKKLIAIAATLAFSGSACAAWVVGHQNTTSVFSETNIPVIIEGA